MIERLKNQIEYILGNITNKKIKTEYRDKFKRIINSNLNDSELETSLVSFLISIEQYE